MKNTTKIFLLISLAFAVTFCSNPEKKSSVPEESATVSKDKMAWWRDAAFLLALAAAVPVWWALWWVAGRPMPDPAWPLVAAGTMFRVAVLYPFLEEWVFRGNLQPWLGKRLPGGWCGISRANLATSLLFASLHLINHPPLAALSVFLPSLVFGWLRDRHGTFATPCLTHGWYNLGYFWVMSGMR